MKKLPEIEAHLLPTLTKFILILLSHFTEKETELPKDSGLTNNMCNALYNSHMTVPILSWENHSSKGAMTCPMSHSRQASDLIVKPSLPCYSTTQTNQSTLDREKRIKSAVWCLKDQAQVSHWKDETPGDGGACTLSWVLGEVTRALSLISTK